MKFYVVYYAEAREGIHACWIALEKGTICFLDMDLLYLIISSMKFILTADYRGWKKRQALNCLANEGLLLCHRVEEIW